MAMQVEGIPVVFSKLLPRSTDLFLMEHFDLFRLRRSRKLVVFSATALRYKLRGICWHDDADHCRTWSEGCRCDLGDES